MLLVTLRLRGSLRQTPRCATPASIERLLDRDRGDQQLLGQPRFARMVKRAILRGDGELYDLHAWVIMHNHAHLLIEPRAGMSWITRSLMEQSEAEAGRTLWSRELHERSVSGECAQAAHLIEHHPVRAGFVSRPEKWEWSSAYAEPVARGSRARRNRGQGASYEMTRN